MEVEAEEVARTRLRLKREAYHGRQETELDHHPANAGADGWIEDVVALLDPPEF